jgi:hypothetical protein
MASARALMAGCLLLGTVSPVLAAPTVTEVLKLRPKQDGVNCTVPSGDEAKSCAVEPVKGTGGKVIGWTLKDGANTTLRRFYDSNDDGRLDVWSFYRDGVEVYREWDSTFKGKADNFRWMNAGGSKWGTRHSDGSITWKIISPEEVSREVFRALVTKDARRFQALLITDADMQKLGLPAAEVERIGKLRAGAVAKFESTGAKLTKLNEKAKWLQFETSVPQTTPADQIGSNLDVVKHQRGTALIALSDGGNEWIQTGQLIKVGLVWRMIDGPVAGANVPETRSPSGGLADMGSDPAVQKLIEQLSKLDSPKNAPTVPSGPEVVKHNLARADLLEEIVRLVPAQQREQFIRQVADSLSTAAQGVPKGDPTAFKRLASLEKQLVKQMKGAHLTAYVVFRHMQADYSVKITGGPFNEVQQAWLEKLAAFVSAYPQAEDTPDAMLQAGLVSEFLSKDVEAKNWYNRLAKAFPDKAQAVKARGAIRRLELEGKPLKLSGPQLDDPNVAFDVGQLKGKVVVVYYWASWNGQCAADFAKLKAIQSANASTVALVLVNLDSRAEDARKFLGRNPVPGTHLYQAGGLEGKLGTYYGIQVLPNLFLVGKDGKVVSRNAQISTLDDEVKKLLKK